MVNHKLSFNSGGLLISPSQVISPVGEVESVDAIRNGEQQLVAVAVTT